MGAPSTRTTERCELVPLASGELDALHEILADPHVREFLMDGEQAPRSFCDRELEQSDALFDQCGVGLWLVRRRGQAQWCGFAGYRVFAELSPDPQLTFALMSQHTGQGLATEVARELLALARTSGLLRVHCAVDVPNVRSRRVLDKLGFVPVGHVPGAFGEIALYQASIDEACTRERARLAALAPATLALTRLWDGRAAPAGGPRLGLSFSSTELLVEVDAPYFGDPAPPGPSGAFPKLWEHEVVELFLLGEDQRYLEVELSPHGHHLVLSLHGVRKVQWQALPLLYRAEIDGDRWRGRARVPIGWLPRGLSRLNAHAIDGVGASRRYWAYSPSSGGAPDFHRLDTFAELDRVFPEFVRGP